jgi:hypothetical protein
MKRILPVKIIFLILAAALFSNKTFAQGCVAIRSTGDVCTMDHLNGLSKSWVLNTNNRYFKSFRHFVGSVEQKQRVEEGTDVRNNSYTMDISLTRNFNSRFSASISVPYNNNTRSSLYEHGGVERHITSSSGMGDLRVAAYGLVFNPSKAPKGNIQFGLGVKFPTGDYDYKDEFHTSTGSEIEGPVDQSIQLGDGGTGITTELNANYHISSRVSVYGNFFYLINPREVNGTSTSRGGKASASSILYTSDVMSVPDQYMLRAGTNVTFKDVTFGVGVRDEGLPSYDLIGGSKGFRRPGFIVSVEPAIIYRIGKANMYIYLPVALLRDRTQSYPDQIRSEKTGTYFKGDAAFSDYALNAGISFKL